MQDDLDVRAPLHPGERDLDVQLAAAGEQELVGLRIAPRAQTRILLDQAVESVADLLVVALRLGFDRERHRRLGELDPVGREGLLLGGEGVARDGEAQLRNAADVAGDELRCRRALLALEVHESVRLLVLFGAHVPELGVVLQRAREDAQDRQAAGERVVQGLEDDGDDRLRGVGFEHRRLAVEALRRIGMLDGRGREVDQEVEQGGAADQMERRADRDRKDLAAEDGALQAGFEVGGVEVALLEELLEQVLVGLGDGLDQPGARFLGFGREIGGDRLLLGLAAAVALEPVGLETDEIDDAGEVLLGPDRQLHRQHLAPEGLLQALETASEVRPFAVHLVAVQDDRQAELGGGLPDLLGVDLGTGHGADADECGVGDAQSRARLGEEDAVAGGVEQIDLVLLPRQVADAEADGDAALRLLGVEVGDGVAVLDLAGIEGPRRRRREGRWSELSSRCRCDR